MGMGYQPTGFRYVDRLGPQQGVQLPTSGDLGGYVPAPPANPLQIAPATLLLHFDGTNGSQALVDSSANNATISYEYGSSAITTADKVFGPSCLGSIQGNGTGASAVIIDCSLPNLSTNQSWFIDCWVKITGSTYPTVGLASWNNGNNQVIIDDGGDGHPGCLIMVGTLSARLTGSNQVPFNVWTHVLFSAEYIDSSTENLRTFINGALDGFRAVTSFSDVIAAPSSAGATFSPSSAFQIGRHDPTGFSGLPQFVDEMHLVVGTAITANFTPPTIPYTH